MTALRSTATARRARTSTHGLDHDPDWRGRALCGPATAEWFTVAGHKLSAINWAALNLCRDCPVRKPCAADALALHPELRRSTIQGGYVFSGDGWMRPVSVSTVNSEGEQR